MNLVEQCEAMRRSVCAFGSTATDVARAIAAIRPALARAHSRMIRSMARELWLMRRELGWRRHFSPEWRARLRNYQMLRGI